MYDADLYDSRLPKESPDFRSIFFSHNLFKVFIGNANPSSQVYVWWSNLEVNCCIWFLICVSFFLFLTQLFCFVLHDGWWSLFLLIFEGHRKKCDNRIDFAACQDNSQKFQNKKPSFSCVSCLFFCVSSGRTTFRHCWIHSVSTTNWICRCLSQYHSVYCVYNM